MKKWIWIPAIILACCAGCASLDGVVSVEKQKETLSKIIDKLHEEGRLSDKNYEDLKKQINKE